MPVVFPEPEQFTCPNCGQEGPTCEIQCAVCAKVFCNHCMPIKTEQENKLTDKAKCPECGKFYTEATYHWHGGIAD